MKDVYTLDGVEGGEIRLVDPNTDHVTSVKNMLLKFNELSDKNFDVSIVEDRRAALAGCDFVLTTFSPGAMDAFWNDLEIPVKYGVRLPVSMTCGVSGISAALRTVPVAYEITRDMEEVCPGAVLLNVTNPMTAVTKAFNLPAKTVTVYGICHEINKLGYYLGRILGLNCPRGMEIGTYLYSYLNEIGFDYAVAGINHYIWLVKANLNGEDMLGRIRQFAEEHEGFQDLGPDYVPTDTYANNGQAKLALCRAFGYLPIPGDRHLIEFQSSLCNAQNGFGMKYGVLKTTVDSRRLDKVLQKQYIDRIASGEEPVSFGRSGEEIVGIMQSYLDKSEMVTICNRPNIGQIANLPEGAIVETLVKKEKDGSITPLPAGELPRPIHHLCYLQTGINEMVVEAALNGDRRLLVEAMSLDPSTGTMDFGRIPELCDDLLNANKKWLPRFFS
jgi:alpha-galactosidase